jgi:D-alanine-D-alanine ligase
MKKRIAVLSGGKSTERDISIFSGKEVLNNLNKNKYDVFEIEILKDGITWKHKNKKTTDYAALLKHLSVDVVFIALHGSGGEDGTVQGMLDLIGINYTGSGVLASALAIDKIYSKTIFTQNGLLTPKSVNLSSSSDKIAVSALSLPLIIKPARGGSSIGNSNITSRTQINSAIKNALRYDNNALVEEYIEGIEITCAILEKGQEARALPLIEIVSKNDYFDYESKYDPKKSDEICPARIDKILTKKAQEVALIAYRSLGCRRFGRVDMIIKNKDVYVLEVNTIPGLTGVSLFPKAAKEAGIPYPQLLDILINSAQEKN